MKADEVIRAPGALLHVLKLSDGVNLILGPKRQGFTHADKPTLSERSNLNSHAVQTATSGGLQCLEPEGV